MMHNTEYESRRELSLLFEISTLLDQSVYLEDVIQPVLNTFVETLDMHRGAITLLNRNTREILIEVSYGLSHDEIDRGRYKLGEGITGTVVATGEPRLIPNIASEPQFLDKTGARSNNPMENISFICTPIKIGKECIGAMSIDEVFKDDETMKHHLHLMSVVTSLISQAVKLRQNIHEEHERLKEENTRLQIELRDRYRPSNIIGDSAGMQRVFDEMADFCTNDRPILLRGESGTGKTLITTALHYSSPRNDLPCIKVSCIALPEEIIEEELFGFEQEHGRRGKLEQASGGTLILVEIGDLPLRTQAKLLHFLQTRSFENANNETIRSNTRIIATTNKNLEALVHQGTFRSELLEIFATQSIHIPSLRERKNDIPLLTNFFIEEYTRKSNKHIARVSTGAINVLMSYHWPGNVSELESCIERAVSIARDKVIHPHHFPPTLQTAEHTNTEFKESLDDALDRLEKSMILDALKRSRGSLLRASRILNITERIMGLRIKKHNINVKDYR